MPPMRSGWLALFVLSSLAALAAGDCSRTSSATWLPAGGALYPLDAPFVLSYQGQPMGLYPGGPGSTSGSNVRPSAHEAAGRAAAATIRPRNAQGDADDTGGSIVLLSIGMSNTTAEYSAFQTLAASEPSLNPRLVTVDGAQGSATAAAIVADPATYWSVVDQRLAQAHVTGAQVQAAWLKEADANPSLAFPGDAQQLEGEIETIIRAARARFPHLAVLYLSSRIYAGYATTSLNPEPYAFESGFAVRAVIEKQIGGAAELSYQNGTAPWLSWGPYLWGDGVIEREDGLAWACSDFADDGTLPSETGALKVARMLLDFFLTDATARPWFARPADASLAAPAIDRLANSATMAAEFANGSTVTIFGSALATGTAVAYTRPLPHSLAGATVLVGGRAVGLYYASPTQINFVYPISPEGTDIKVVREGVESKAVDGGWAFWAPGVFAIGQNQAAAEHLDGTVVSPAAPAHRGEVLAVWLTGCGVRNPISSRPDPLPRIFIDGQAATLTPTVCMAAPSLPGLNQINFVVPQGASSGSAVSFEFWLATLEANPTTIAVQ